MIKKSGVHKLIIGNWKMKKDLRDSILLAKEMVDKFKDFKEENKEVAVCPNLVSLTEVKRILKGSRLKLGAQNVFWEPSGAYTGEISAKTLEEAGCHYVIIGHSERRKYLLENYSMIHQKVKAALNTSVVPVVCIGEEPENRKTDRRDFVLMNQIQEALGGVDVLSKQRVVVAYEPVWAIGSGTAIEPEEARYAHRIIKLALNDMYGMKMVKENFRIIYGGSVNSKNIRQFSGLEDVDGLLVGGASLEADEFYKICKNVA